MRNRKSNGLPALYGEQLGHPRSCGCGCWLTPEQWQAEDDNDQGLRLVEFDGSYVTQTPNPNGCMHCGADERSHGQLWLRSIGWHSWEPPSDAQRLERMKQRRVQRVERGEVFCMFCWSDDCGGGCYG